VVRAARKRAGLSDGFPASDPLFVELILDEGPIQDRRAMWPLAIIILAACGCHLVSRIQRSGLVVEVGRRSRSQATATSSQQRRQSALWMLPGT